MAAPFVTGQEITIRGGELVAGGDALAKVDGFPIFVANVFPGDVAKVRLYEVKKGFARADLVELLEPSPERRAAPCPIANECGGCDWTALRLDAQLRAKERIVRESLRRVGKIDPASLPPIRIHPSPLNYRIRSRLHQQNGAVGFYAMRSHRVVPLSSVCEVVGPETAREFGTDGPSVSPWFNETQPQRHRESHDEAAGPDDETPRADEREIWEIGGKLISDEREITIAAGEFRYDVSTDAFFQVNRHLLATMLERVTAIASATARKESAVDLYAGAGFFTAPLSRIFGNVTAVESARSSHDAAKKNAGPNVKLVSSPVETWVAHMRKTDFVFLDPPRAGARPNVIDTVARRALERVCYLSCDPVTFSRDASRLIASGWRLSTLELLDLFPNTHHVETLSSFERAS